MDSFAYAIARDAEAVRRRKLLKINRKHIRDASDPFDMDPKFFIRNFRLSKVAFKYVLDELQQELEPGVFSSSIESMCRLSAALRFLGEGGYQLSVGNDSQVGMAHSTFSRNLKIVLNALEKRLCPLWIKIDMSDFESRDAKRTFYSKASFPGVIMCVDGTHINIIAPPKEKALYYNRKGNFSINVMLICDHKMNIKCVDARYPGSNHDSHVWNLSGARRYFQSKYMQGERNTWILGDAGYPLEPWLMTPFRSADPGSAKSIYNTKHSKTRNIVERTIGVLKNRFRCTLGARQLHYSPEKAVQIVNVVCALHNICIHYRVEDYATIHLPENEHQEEHADYAEGNDSTYRRVATTIRENVLNTIT